MSDLPQPSSALQIRADFSQTPSQIAQVYVEALEAGEWDSVAPRISKIIKERKLRCYKNGMTHTDWTDWTLVRLGWKLDEDRRNPGLLEEWQKAVAFSILGTAKRTGESYRIPAEKMDHVRSILRAKVEDGEALVE